MRIIFERKSKTFCFWHGKFKKPMDHSKGDSLNQSWCLVPLWAFPNVGTRTVHTGINWRAASTSSGSTYLSRNKTYSDKQDLPMLEIIYMPSGIRQNYLYNSGVLLGKFLTLVQLCLIPLDFCKQILETKVSQQHYHYPMVIKTVEHLLYSKAVFKSQLHQNHLRGWIKYRLLGPTPLEFLIW